MTKEQTSISYKNHKQAIKYFECIGELPKNRKPYEYVLHHKNPDWKEDDIERYIQWNVDDLVVMTKAEHNQIHTLGKHPTEEVRRRMSEAQKGRTVSNESINKRKSTMQQKYPNGIINGMLGKHHTQEAKDRISRANTGRVVTEETRLKLSKTHKGNKHTEETKQKLSIIAKNRPATKGTTGMRWFNNGIISKMFLPQDIPEGFVLGKLKRSNKECQNE